MAGEMLSNFSLIRESMGTGDQLPRHCPELVSNEEQLEKFFDKTLTYWLDLYDQSIFLT